MPKVKLVVTYDISDPDDYYSSQIIRQGITDWEDISGSELQFLRDNRWRLNSLAAAGGSVAIIVQDEVSILDRITTIRGFIRQEEDRAREEAEKKERAKQEKLLKRQAKTKADEIALLERLKEKYPDGQL